MRNLSFILFSLLPFILLSQEGTHSNITAHSLTYHLQQDADTLKLPPLQWILEEGVQPLSFEQLLKGETADAKLIDLKDNQRFDIQANHAYWFKLRLSTSNIESAYGLAFYRTGNCWPLDYTFSEVQTFQQTKGKGIKTGHSGSATPGSKRDYPKDFTTSFINLDLMANDTTEAWCKVIMQTGCNMQVDMELVKEELIVQARPETIYNNLQNVLRGTSLALFFIAALLFLWFKEKVYLWFMIFLVASFLFGTVRDYYNELFTLFFSEAPITMTALRPAIGGFMFISLLHLGRVYVNTKSKFPKIHLILGVAIFTLVLLVTLGTLLKFIPVLPKQLWNGIRPLMGLAFLITAFSGLVLMAISKDKLAQFFGIGALIPPAILLLGYIQVFLFNTTYSINIPLMLSGGFFLTLTTVMAYRFRLEIIAKESALKEKIDSEIAQNKQQQELLLATEQTKRLNELDAMKSNFFANVTHELRTPLTLILSPLDGLLKYEKLSNKGFTQLKTIQQNGQDLLKLTNEILELTKLESSKVELNETTVVLYPFIQRLVGVFETYAQKKDIQLSLEYTVNPQLQVSVDQKKLEKIVNNLLSNAMKFTPAKGSVQVKVIDIGKAIQINVTDTGRGIHPDDLPHIFNRFYQSQQPNAVEGGTGIGLSMAQEFAKLLGGGITVQSDLDTGSTFTFEFVKKEVMRPLRDEDLLAIRQQKAAAPVIARTEVQVETPVLVPNAATSKILLVEDNQQLRSYIQSLLHENHQVFTAENGQDALDFLSKTTTADLPDLIISDVMMPIMDGFQLLKTLKESDQYCSIPIVMLTARVQLEDKLTALRIGVDDYMIKPFVEEELLARVKNLMNNAQARKQPVQEETPEQEVLTEQPPIQSEEHQINQEDLQWLAEVEQAVLAHLSDFEFNLERLSELIYLSPRQTRRRIKQVSGLPFSQYLREARFNKARLLLEQGEVRNIKQIAYDVGMRNAKYFSKQFKAHFGKTPSAYLE